MEPLNQDQLVEVTFMVSQLQIVLGQDNNARKGAEEHLKKIKDGEPDKYACYLTAVIMDQNAGADIKALASVVLRRGIGSAITGSTKTLWEVLTPNARDFLKTNLLSTVKTIQIKDLMHKMSNLLVEIAGGMYENED